MVQSMVEILQNCVAFSEYKNFKNFFANGKMKKKLPSKVAHNRPKCIFSVLSTGPKPAQISNPVP